VRTAAGGDVEALRGKRLLVPVAGIEAKTLRSTFEDSRGGGRRHEAMDILAPRGASVVAAVDGRIVKLFTSAAGGLTIYQYDPEEEFCYYYAHLDGYVADLTEGQTVKRGQTIGYVGTTGNAPPGTPHLHFAIFKLDANKRWWEGDALDPFLVLR
jgi:murein DD-endopeptidase MepM/ murein hydrolase activator NlpD